MEWDNTDINPLPEHYDVNEDTMNSISDWITFHQKRVQYYTGLKREYRSGGEMYAYRYQQTESHKLPKKPENVKFTLVKRESTGSISKPLDQLKGIQLLEELKKHLRTDSTKGGNVKEFDPEETDATKIENIIQEGERFIVYKHKMILADAVQLGLWMEKLVELTNNGFKNFVDCFCEFSVQWAYKIRKYAKVFSKYPRLQQLNISLTMATKICDPFERALTANPNHQHFWSQSAEIHEQLHKQ